MIDEKTGELSAAATDEELVRLGRGMRHTFRLVECPVCDRPACLRAAMFAQVHEEHTALRHRAEAAEAELAAALAEVRRLRDVLSESELDAYARAIKEAVPPARRAERERCKGAIRDARVASMKMWTRADSDALDAISALPDLEESA